MEAKKNISDERRRMRMRTDPEYRERKRRYHREYQRRMRADPERRKVLLENQKRYRQLKRKLEKAMKMNDKHGIPESS